MQVLLLAANPAAAQREYSNWYFGTRAGVTFPGGSSPPQLSPGSQMVSGEGCASISNAKGELLFYTNGVQAWNKQHQLLANSSNLGGYSGPSESAPNSSTQGVAVVPQPGSTTRYYIFMVDAAENGLSKGLTYSVVDMSLQGGLGEVVSKNVLLRTPVGDGRLTEKLQVVRHANQRDIWVLVHAWNSNAFCSFLLTADGITSSSAVVSASGTVHQGGGNGRNDYNALGCMKVSPNGRRLAVVRYTAAPVEVFNFSTGTGIVSNPQLVGNTSGYGVEFSPNSQLLYVSNGGSIYQYVLQTGEQTRLQDSGYASFAPSAWALQLGPDGKLYSAEAYTSFLGVIALPDRPGLACDYRPRSLAVATAPGSVYLGLPNVLVTPPTSAEVQVAFTLLSTDVCLGESTAFTAAIYPALPGAVASWDFGDPLSGTAANTATGLTVAHRYAASGTYAVSLLVRNPSNGREYTSTQSVRVLPKLASRVVSSVPQPCSGTETVLSVAPAPASGTTYRWQDGSTGATLKVRTPGLYWVELASPLVCTTRDSLRLAFAPLPAVSLGPSRLLGCEETLVLDATAALPGTTYLWQDGSTDAQLRVNEPGTYSVTLTSAAGCLASSSVVLRRATDCAVSIPNIITPNGDGRNDYLVIQGIPAGTAALSLFNRWGQAVYQRANYLNDWNASGLPAGLYYYLLVVPFTKQRYQGWVEVHP